MGYKHDASGIVVNHIDTYGQAARDLVKHGSIVLNWTDSRGSLFNVLMSYSPPRYGAQGGIVDGSGSKLWVAVAGKGAYAFNTGSDSAYYVAPDYVSEKLGIAPGSAPALSELVSHIRMLVAA